MKDIKSKELDKTPRVRNLASRMPKEIMRSAVLQAKEKSHRMLDTSSGTGQESPTEYAGQKITDAEEWAGSKAGSAALAGGRRLAKKSYEKTRERKQIHNAVKEARAAEWAKEDEKGKGVQSAGGLNDYKEEAGMSGNPARVHEERGRMTAGRAMESETSKIKMRMKQKEFIRTVDKRSVKTAPRNVKSFSIPGEKIKEASVTPGKGQNVFAKRMARQSAIKAAKAAQVSARTTKTTIKTAAKGAITAVKGMTAAVKTLMAAITAGGWIVVLLIVIVGVIGGAMFSSGSQSQEPLSQEVQAYTPTIQKYANQYGIPEYVSSLQAIMMQESGGRGADPMQSSECPYNTRFPNSPNAINDPEYSIQVGVQYYASCVAEARCTSPQDMDKLRLSWQGYNYGNGYISWAIQKFGGYSAQNALQFSQEQAASHGWERYGDPEYVPHVERYYSGGNLFAGLFGNEQIVTVAKAQIGNEGGQKFWSWYGFGNRVEWCACFVSWCADQCGLISSGAVPKFALCSDGVSWFKSKQRWQERNAIPTPGSIIFFDWPDENGNRDGVSNHVGIVEKCENGIVFTIEGNSGDKCKQNSYPVGYASILGYGIPSL